jgi:formylmethanofuran dehydrogenase subunit B
MLERGEVDACLLVGSETVAKMSPQAIEHLKRIPTIALDHPSVTSGVSPAVCFTTAAYGIHAAGTAYRMDEVPIPLRKVLTCDYPTDADVLQRIGEEAKRKS